MALLTVENLTKSFGSLSVLKGISFSMEQGDTLSVIGPSGGGKTTFLRCLNFLEMPDGGRIVINSSEEKLLFDGSREKPLSEAEKRENRLHFGLVFQNFNLFPQYTALENVTLALRLREKDKKVLSAIEAQGKGLLERVGLGDKLGFYPHQLSGGQQQRVAIARALALRPEILFFDEPTSALDPELTGEVLKVIRQLAEERTTMVIVTHEMPFARAVSDRVLFMDEGLIAEEGSPEEVFGNPRQERPRQFLRNYQ